MRRLLAMLLMLVFALPGAAPLLASVTDTPAQVPLCCRQGGEHHCAGMLPTGQTTLRMSCPVDAQPVLPLPNQAAWIGVRSLLRSADAVSTQAACRTAGPPRGQRLVARDSRGPPQA